MREKAHTTELDVPFPEEVYEMWSSFPRHFHASAHSSSQLLTFPIWFTFGDRVICDRIKNKRSFTFFLMEFFLPKCHSCPCLPYLLALRSLHTLAKKECYACLYFPRNLSLIVLCVALLPRVFIVALNADWLTSPVLDSQYASY